MLKGTILKKVFHSVFIFVLENTASVLILFGHTSHHIHIHKQVCLPSLLSQLQDSGMKIRKERYFNLPLCLDECINWWNSCKDDRTCIENWTRGFDWGTGNSCKLSIWLESFMKHFYF